MVRKKKSQEKNWQEMIPAGHAAPKTRREFFAYGMLGMAGAIAMPGLLTLLTEKRAFGADAASCGGTGGGLMNAMLPLLVYDLAGGANIPYGNVLVGKVNPNGTQTDFLDDSASVLLGVPPAQNPKNNPQMADNELGLLFHANSAFLAGLRSSTSAETRAKMDGMVFCTRSMDDTGNNPLNPSFWIAGAGAKGALVDIVGNGNSPGKGNSTVPGESLSGAPTASIKSPAAALSLVNKGLLGTIVPKQEEKILKAAHSMSAAKLQQYNEKALPAQIKELVECGYIKSIENMTAFTEEALDVKNDQAATAARAVNNIGTDTRIPTAFQPTQADPDIVTTMAKLVLDGYAGVGTITAGGYDYHGNSRQQQAIRDFRAGRNVGMAFEMARLKNKPLAVTVITDGGVGARGGATDNTAEGRGMIQFTSDDGTKSSALMLVFNPVARPESTGIRQVGGFLDGSGSVNPQTPIGNSPLNLTKAITLNYLALQGKEGIFDTAVKGNPFGADLSKLIGFTKLKT